MLVLADVSMLLSPPGRPWMLLCPRPHGPRRWEALHGPAAGPGLQLGPHSLILQHLQETSHNRGQVKGQPRLQQPLQMPSPAVNLLVCPAGSQEGSHRPGSERSAVRGSWTLCPLRRGGR